MNTCYLCGKVKYGVCEFKAIHNQHNKDFNLCRDCYYNHIKLFLNGAKAISQIRNNPSILQNNNDIAGQLQKHISDSNDETEMD